MKRTRKELNRSKRSGAVAVEAALGLVILITLLLGIIEFGRALTVGQLVTNAAREGARLSVVDGTTNEDVEDRVVNFLQETLNIGNPDDLTVVITVEADEDNADPGNEVGQASTGDLCTIDVSVPYNEVSFGVLRFLRNSTLSGRVTMRHE